MTDAKCQCTVGTLCISGLTPEPLCSVLLNCSLEISHGILHQQKQNNAPLSLVILDLQSLVIPLSLPSLREACKFKKQAALNCPQVTEPGDLQHSTSASHLKWEVPGVRSCRFPYVYERVRIELFAYVHVCLPHH